MCGIVGIVWSDPRRTSSRETLSHALESIRHRGPDGDGLLNAPGFAAGMRRLAIIDLEGGDQPIFNETGEIGVLYNGEIYNYRELRRLMESRGHTFRTQSDTEVLVHLYEEFGPGFVSRLDGMFAFALWDAPRRRALLARDRFGIKPLYLAHTPNGIAFASETKALAAAGWVRPQIDPTMLPAYFQFAWVPEPHTLWRGVTRLLPGHYLEINDGRAAPIVQYHRHRIGGGTARSDREVDADIARLVRAAVSRQLVADVPVGLFLSGGLDSSIIAAAAQRSGAELPCHTIEFRSADLTDDPMGDDAAHARILAKRLGLDLHVHTITPRAVDLLPRLLRHMDDPAADPAIITAYLISEAARPFTKVLLSGMGADEIAGGYRRHVAARALTPFYGLPQAARSRAAHALKYAGSLLELPGASRRPNLRRVQKALERIPPGIAELPEAFATWTPPSLIRSLGLEPAASLWPAVTTAVELSAPMDPLEASLAFDVATYLPSHNLLYVDKAAMAASVEVRVPFLDNELAAYLMALPPDQKVRRATSKVALRRAARSMLPRSILRRAKSGFGAPIRGWLLGELRPMVEDLLSPRAVRSRGLLDPAGVEAVLKLHRRDVSDLAYTVWGLLSLEIWCREVMDPARSP